MFSLMPYPRAPGPEPELPPLVPPGGRPVRVCLVVDAGTEAARRLIAELAGSGVALSVLDLAGTPGPAPAGAVGHVWLRGLFEPRHEFTPLVSLCAYHWLAGHGDFDLILFAGGFGAGYYSMVAKGQGLAFAGTTLAVAAGSCHARRLEQNGCFPQGRTDLELDFLERETLRRADALAAGDPAFPGWCRAAGWTLPAVVPVATLVHPAAVPAPAPTRSGSLPLVSVCLPTYNRPDLLREVLASLLRQRYPRLEVIVVDDGSTDPAVAECLAGMAGVFAERGWSVLRQDNAGPGAARNAAVRRAAGDYLLFMDDDNLALCHEIERFVTAALASGADVLTCIPGRHPGTTLGPEAVAQLPTPDPEHPSCGVDWTPVGASLALAAMVNCLGDNNALWRRSAFEALDGFQGSRASAFEDMRLLLLAVVRGFRLEVVPEILFLYRRHEQSRSMGDTLFLSHVECLAPLTELVPRELWPLLLTVHRDWYERHVAWTAPAARPEED